MLSINLLGSLEVSFGARTLSLPTSRKTRALLGYLVISGAPQRRDRLCELFWDVPDDPRGSLRWSLSRLRPAVNHGDAVRLHADRERVRIDLDDVSIDLHRVRAAASDDAVSPDDIAAAWELADQVLMADCELSNQDSFTAWLVREREEVERLRARLARRMVVESHVSPSEMAVWADRWLASAPFDAEAAESVVAARKAVGLETKASALAEELESRFREAGLRAPDFSASASKSGRAAQQSVAEDNYSTPRQKVQFVKAQDGTCLAWASVGDERRPPIVKAANWLTHLELDWEAPIWSPLFRDLARDHRLIRYDERGCGLSDWEVPEISFETFVSDLELVVDSAGLDKFPLLGISQGAAVSIEYVARHPDRVTRLILFGGYPAGWRHTAPPGEVREREAVMVLTESGWGRSDPAYRNLFSRTFMPDAAHEEIEWFDEFQRRTTSAENAVRFLEAFSRIDVRARLSSINVPTLVIHSRGDKRIPLSTGRELAASIPNAQFVSLESNNHLLLGREQAAGAFLKEIRHFLHA